MRVTGVARFQPFLRFWFVVKYVDGKKELVVSTLLEILGSVRKLKESGYTPWRFQPFLRFWTLVVDSPALRLRSDLFQPFLRFWSTSPMSPSMIMALFQPFLRFWA